jgi:hypothetical protein
MAILTGLLGSLYGANGAGGAFGCTLSCVALLFLVAANRDVSMLMNSDDESAEDLTS